MILRQRRDGGSADVKSFGDGLENVAGIWRDQLQRGGGCLRQAKRYGEWKR